MFPLYSYKTDSTYQKWWCIEDYHKSIKQNAGLEKSSILVCVIQTLQVYKTCQFL